MSKREEDFFFEKDRREQVGKAERRVRFFFMRRGSKERTGDSLRKSAVSCLKGRGSQVLSRYDYSMLCISLVRIVLFYL